MSKDGKIIVEVGAPKFIMPNLLRSKWNWSLTRALVKMSAR